MREADAETGSEPVGMNGDRAAELTRFTLVVHVEVFGSARAGVLPEQQVADRQLAVSVALTLRQQLLHGKHQRQFGI